MMTEIKRAAYLLQLLFLITAIPSISAVPNPHTSRPYPTRQIAGISVVDTPIVRAAHDLTYRYNAPYLYKHVMRSWLFGASILSHNASLASTVDKEVHAVAVLLHDLGVAEHSPFISTDRRFEVDGADAAREFVRNFTSGNTTGGQYGPDWSSSGGKSNNQQLIWDAIALHSQKSIAIYKEPIVATTSNGIMMDFLGPGYGVEQAEYDAVLAAFPRDDFLPGFNATLVWLAETKPMTTYDTWQQAFGDHFVPGYSAVGYRAFDLIAGVDSE